MLAGDRFFQQEDGKGLSKLAQTCAGTLQKKRISGFPWPAGLAGDQPLGTSQLGLQILPKETSKWVLFQTLGQARANRRL